MSDLSTIATATAAGYAIATSVGGSGFLCELSKQVDRFDGNGPFILKGLGDRTTLNAATTAALASLNGERAYRWGAGATGNKNNAGVTQTIDT
jgi:hypothetical protein